MSALQRRVGAMFDRDRRPEELVGFAQALDALGVDDLWVVEDLGWAGGLTSAAVALASTTRLRLGIGIVPAPLRNPALLAMELATLARLYPGRLVTGIGHGVPGWMAQVGAGTPAKLALLEETIVAVRGLLRGEPVTLDGRAVHLHDVRLTHPPTEPPAILAGVVRPRSLELAGRVADGTIIAEGHGPDEIAAALGHIGKGRTAPGAPAEHELTVLAYLCVDEDPARVRAATAAMVAGQAEWLGIEPSQVYLIAGSAAGAAAQVRELWDAGAGTVALRPLGEDPLGQVRAVAAAL
ncbi:MAG TPA: LLM class flavin-dependent oxidoreductase [Dactylosporangium sp.]|jgi:5,10-methylenetetrahydromethanopterin reductase|nr:LLM class flavin-dependent oxidoreductase [Dactylosporangium sp.]